jgi:hypothetical protein
MIVAAHITQLRAKARTGSGTESRLAPRPAGWERAGKLRSMDVFIASQQRSEMTKPIVSTRRAPGKTIMHNSAGITPGGFVGLRFGWDSPG